MAQTCVVCNADLRGAGNADLRGLRRQPAWRSRPRPAWSVEAPAGCGADLRGLQHRRRAAGTQTCMVCTRTPAHLRGAGDADLRGLWTHLRGRRPAWSVGRTCGVPETQTCVVCGRTCGVPETQTCVVCGRTCGVPETQTCVVCGSVARCAGPWYELNNPPPLPKAHSLIDFFGARQDRNLREYFASILRSWVCSHERSLGQVMAADEEAKATSTSYSETEESGQNKPPVSPTSDAADTPPASEPVRPKEPAEPPKTSACVTRGNATKGKAPAGAPAGHCQWCWRKLGKAAAAQDQHTYSNLHCITWQMYESQSPPRQDWRAAQKAAERLKRNRDNQMYPERQSQPAASAHKAKQEEPDCSQPKVKRAASATNTRRKKKDKSKRKKDSSSPGSPSPAPKKKKEKKKKKKLSSSDSSAEPRQKKRKGSGSLQGKIIINM